MEKVLEVEFCWSADCQKAFNELKMRLITAPVLAYPNVDIDFVLETDASYQGLGAVFSQRLADQNSTQWPLEVEPCPHLRRTTLLQNWRI